MMVAAEVVVREEGWWSEEVVVVDCGNIGAGTGGGTLVDCCTNNGLSRRCIKEKQASFVSILILHIHTTYFSQ